MISHFKIRPNVGKWNEALAAPWMDLDKIWWDKKNLRPDNESRKKNSEKLNIYLTDFFFVVGVWAPVVPLVFSN